jgi:hypothetical protein
MARIIETATGADALTFDDVLGSDRQSGFGLSSRVARTPVRKLLFDVENPMEASSRRRKRRRKRDLPRTDALRTACRRDRATDSTGSARIGRGIGPRETGRTSEKRPRPRRGTEPMEGNGHRSSATTRGATDSSVEQGPGAGRRSMW